jgi:hypothetical protein
MNKHAELEKALFFVKSSLMLFGGQLAYKGSRWWELGSAFFASSSFFFFNFSLLVLIEPGASHILGKRSTTLLLLK